VCNLIGLIVGIALIYGMVVVFSFSAAIAIVATVVAAPFYLFFYAFLKGK
jgi:hypothetical protein